MRRFDFRCMACGRVAEDVVLASAQSPRTDAPVCCDQPMDWLPQMRMSLISDSARQPVQMTQPDGTVKEVEVSSLADIRRLEAESERAYRNGDPHAQPLRWRAYSQGDSNRDVNTFGPDPGQRPDPDFVKRVKPRAATAEQIAAMGEYGPGVSDANTSAVAE